MGQGLSIKKFLPRTLFGRSLLILVTPVVLIQIITTFVFFDRHWSKMSTRLAFAVAGEIAVVTTALNEGQSAEKIENIVRYAKRHLNMDIEFKPDMTLPEADEFSGLQIWESVVAAKVTHELERQLSEDFTVHADFSKKEVVVFVELEGGVLSVEFPQNRLFSSSGYVFLLWVFATSVLLLVIAIIFMRNQIRPIRKLAVAADRFGKGRETPFFKPEGAREVRQAGAAFLDMRRRIERQVSQRTEMLAGVSHDLRTPLTRLKLQIEMLSKDADKAAMSEDIQEMERMIQGYLDFVRGDGEEEFENVSIHDVFAKLRDAKRPQNIEINLDIPEELAVEARPLAFERAMGNLINNAAKYADGIWVKSFLSDEKVQIQVEDNGPGIPEEFFEEVFKPFTRVDTSRNMETGGVGLGLAIVMDIVHSHGGKIWLEKSTHGGLCVIVRMPL